MRLQLQLVGRAVTHSTVSAPAVRSVPPSASPTRDASAPLEVAITIDDLPIHGPPFKGIDRVKIAEQFLAAFRAHRVPAVYGFVNGKGVHDDPSGLAILERWVAAGHPLGNHTYSHVSLNDLAPSAYLADLEQGELILEKLLPGDPSWRFFRYPFLFEEDTLEKYDAVRRYLATHQYRIADVTIAAEDWLWNPVFARCAAQRNTHAVAELRRGLVRAHVNELRYIRKLTHVLTGRDVKHVLLLHIGAASAAAVSPLLAAFENEGVRWIDLPTALSDPFYAAAPRAASRFGAALPYRVAKARGVKLPPAPDRAAQEALPGTCP